MLVLTRREGQDVLIRVPGLAHPIQVRAVLVKEGRVRLGFIAPRDVLIDREEVDEAKCELAARAGT